MTQISIQDLKKNLSAIMAKAEGGEKILVTRHSKPVVALSSISLDHVLSGPLVGKLKMRPILRGGLGGKALEVLREDREDRF